MVNEKTVVWRALGETDAYLNFSRAVVWGPREVGGAEAGPERLQIHG